MHSPDETSTPFPLISNKVQSIIIFSIATVKNCVRLLNMVSAIDMTSICEQQHITAELSLFTFSNSS